MPVATGAIGKQQTVSETLAPDTGNLATQDPWQCLFTKIDARKLLASEASTQQTCLTEEDPSYGRIYASMDSAAARPGELAPNQPNLLPAKFVPKVQVWLKCVIKDTSDLQAGPKRGDRHISNWVIKMQFDTIRHCMSMFQCIMQLTSLQPNKGSAPQALIPVRRYNIDPSV